MGGFWTLQRTARLLKARRRVRKALPPLLFFTDPGRTPDPEAVALRLPPGSAVVFRGFGAPDAEARAMRLRVITRARRLKLLIGQDSALARRVGADGVHLPERLAFRAGVLKRRRPDWIVTVAAHSPRAMRAGKQADAVVVSTAFPSASPSAGPPVGSVRLAAWTRATGATAYALGGVTDETARRLVDAGLAGLGAVEGLARP